MSKVIERQKLIHLSRQETGEHEIDMRKVAAFAVKKGWPLPTPTDPMDLLAKQFSEAARLEVRRDKITKRPYRANHAVPTYDENGQMVFFWIDIDDLATTRNNMRKSLVMRREQMVDDGLQLTLDLDHWHSLRPDEEKIVLPMDLTPDIEWRKNSLDDEDDAA